jgi:hypothetical protein
VGCCSFPEVVGDPDQTGLGLTNSEEGEDVGGELIDIPSHHGRFGSKQSIEPKGIAGYGKVEGYQGWRRTLAAPADALDLAVDDRVFLVEKLSG